MGKLEILLSLSGIIFLAVLLAVCNSKTILNGSSLLSLFLTLLPTCTIGNGGHLWPGLGNPISEEIERIGEDQAVSLWNFTVYNLGLVEKFVKENSILFEVVLHVRIHTKGWLRPSAFARVVRSCTPQTIHRTL